MTAQEEAANISVPVKAKIKQRVPWEDRQIIEKRESTRTVYEEHLKKKTRSSEARLEDKKKELNEVYNLNRKDT